MLGRQGTTLYELFRMLLGEPLLFILVGAVLGEITQTVKSRYEALLDEHEELKGAFEKLKERYDAMVKAKQEVDTRILSQEQTLSTHARDGPGPALPSPRRSSIPRPWRWWPSSWGAEACSIYLFAEGRLRLKSGLGELEGRQRPQDARPGRGGSWAGPSPARARPRPTCCWRCTRRASCRTRTRSSRRRSSQAAARSWGVVNIEKLPFLKFNSQTIRMAEVFAGWCADALENALLYTDTKSKTITDDITGAYTAGYMHSRMTEECARAPALQDGTGLHRPGTYWGTSSIRKSSSARS